LSEDALKIIARYAFRPPNAFCESAEIYMQGFGVEWMAGIEMWKTLTFSQIVACCVNPLRLHTMGATQSLLEALRYRERLETVRAPGIWQERKEGLEFWQAAATQGDRAMMRRGMIAIEASLNNLDHAYGVYANDLFRFGQCVTHAGTLYITGERKDR
jgi:hypothetical protein